MIRDVLRMGDGRLLVRSKEVTEFDTKELHALLADMRDTMAYMNGAGLAAPQIGVPLRVVIFGAQNLRSGDRGDIPETTLINPVVEPIGLLTTEDWEGCLSVPGLRGRVPRYEKVRYRGFDVTGNTVDRLVDGFHARVVQHECDHLDGVLYPMRIRDFNSFGFVDVLFPDAAIQDD